MKQKITSETEANILSLIASSAAGGPVRVDRWVRGGSWTWLGFRPLREYEVWQLRDGRRARLVRTGTSGEWKLDQLERAQYLGRVQLG
ncbi:hypothetical protein [Deinococcus sp.]|uniref:hypothetical protein n=1 Tax=Deinococcus sp. TaxID=47478 RepID=UPI003CC65083